MNDQTLLTTPATIQTGALQRQPVASPICLPPWAKNGGIAYCRWDGGPMEVAKAGLSGWDFLTDPDAVCAMTEWYGERGFQLIREAGFNWIWVTWSTGFSEASEQQQQDILRPFIRRCQEHGIHVTAYLSLCNLFVADIRRRQPDLLDCAQRDAAGSFIPYAAAKFVGQPERIMACLNHPRWRDHLRHRLQRAIDAGADAAFYDNLGPWCQCPRCQEQFRRYCQRQAGLDLDLPQLKTAASPNFEEVAASTAGSVSPIHWQLAQAYYAALLDEVAVELTRFAETIRPEFMVYLNWHVFHHTFGGAGLKALSTEDGQRPCHVGANHAFPTEPGFACNGYVSNSGLLRRMLATADGVRPLRVQSHQTTCLPCMEARDFEPYGERDWQRLLAECWCFRAAQEVFLEGNFQTRLFRGDPDAQRAWRAIAEYNRFQQTHRDRWVAHRHPAVAFAILLNDNYPPLDRDYQRVKLLTALALAGYQFDVVLDHQLAPDRLRKYPVLWCPSTECLADSGLAAIESYLGAGGRVVTSGPFAEWSALGRRRPGPQREAWLNRLRAAGGPRFVSDTTAVDRQIAQPSAGAGLVPALVQQAQERFPVRVAAEPMPILWTCWSLPDGRRLVFVLNPDSRGPRRDLRIRVSTPSALEWHTPEASDAGFSVAPDSGGSVCCVPLLTVFGFCVLTPVASTAAGDD
jgi:hypothetical protein